MIDLIDSKIKKAGTEEPIRKWIVMFMTPAGLFEDLAEAVAWCNKNDFLPQHNIRPVPVAVSETTYEASV